LHPQLGPRLWLLIGGGGGGHFHASGIVARANVLGGGEGRSEGGGRGKGGGRRRRMEEEGGGGGGPNNSAALFPAKEVSSFLYIRPLTPLSQQASYLPCRSRLSGRPRRRCTALNGRQFSTRAASGRGPWCST
jgi:hypothetical protein